MSVRRKSPGSAPEAGDLNIFAHYTLRRAVLPAGRPETASTPPFDRIRGRSLATDTPFPSRSFI